MNEVTHGKKKKIVAMKIDISKAYDSLDWSFVKKTLDYFNFPSNLSHLIMNCI